MLPSCAVEGAQGGGLGNMCFAIVLLLIGVCPVCLQTCRI